MKTRISEDILRSLIRKKLLSEAPRNPLDQAIKDAGVSFDLNCPLDGEYKVGGSWYETH